MFTMTAQEEQQLLSRARGGDAKAFSQLVRQHHVALRRYLTSFLRDAVVADDLAQDVFVAALRDIKGYESRAPFIAWLFGIARHQAKMYLRSEARRSARTQKLGFSTLWNEAERDLDPRAYEDELLALEACLGTIPSHAADLIRQHYFAATPLTDIARRDGKKEGSVRVALLRARLWLRSCIEARLSRVASKNTAEHSA